MAESLKLLDNAQGRLAFLYSDDDKATASGVSSFI